MDVTYCNLEYLLGVVKIDENDALEKIKMYHRQCGDNVFEWNPIENHTKHYDKAYCSSIFTFTDKSVLPIDDRWICGGTGFDLHNKLPPEIEVMQPRKNFGFTSRGCNNNCKFCCVPEKEGKCRPAIDDIKEVWDGESKEIKFKDNNILQLPEHFYKVCDQLKKYRPSRKKSLTVDFNQGLDIRILDKDMAKELASLSHVEYKFAFDSIKLEQIIIDKVELLKSVGINRSTFYCLIGYDSTLEEDIYRFNLLRELGQNVSPMPYRKIHDGMLDTKINNDNFQIYDCLDCWGSVKIIFQGFSLYDFITKSVRGKQYKKHFDKLGLTV